MLLSKARLRFDAGSMEVVESSIAIRGRVDGGSSKARLQFDAELMEVRRKLDCDSTQVRWRFAMDYEKQKMIEVADCPRGEWGFKMLERMDSGHRKLIVWGLEGLFDAEELETENTVLAYLVAGSHTTEVSPNWIASLARRLSTCEAVLDVGCGSGNALAMLDAACAAAKTEAPKFFGVDYSGESVDVARRNCADAIAAGRMQIDFGDVLELQYEDGFFDLIVSTESFYYWGDFPKALGELKRVLKPGGQVLIILEAHADFALTHEDARKEHDEIASNVNIFFPSIEFLKTVFADAGFVGSDWSNSHGKSTEIDIRTKGDWITVLATKA